MGFGKRRVKEVFSQSLGDWGKGVGMRVRKVGWARRLSLTPSPPEACTAPQPSCSLKSVPGHWGKPGYLPPALALSTRC